MTPIAALKMRRASTGSGGGGSGSQRQVMVPTPLGASYVNTSATADKQYMLPGGTYLNEQS